MPNTLLSEVFCGLDHNVGKRWLSFIARAVLSLGRSRAIAKHTGFRSFLWVGSSCWEEVAFFHCKSCAFSRLKPHYCQTQWFQRFLAHDDGKRWLFSVARAFRELEATAKGLGKVWGVSLIGGFGWGFDWGVRGVLRIVFLIPATPSRPSQWFYKAFFCHLGQAPVAWWCRKGFGPLGPGSVPGRCVLQPGGGTQLAWMLVCCAPFLCQCLAVMLATFACFWTLPLITSRWLYFIARAVLSLGRSRTIAKHSGLTGFLWVGSSCWEEVALFHCQELCFPYVEAVGSSCWEEVTLFHCKNYAFIRSKPHYCQTHCFQRFFVGWLIMLGRGDSLSLQELCFH